VTSTAGDDSEAGTWTRTSLPLHCTCTAEPPKILTTEKKSLTLVTAAETGSATVRIPEDTDDVKATNEELEPHSRQIPELEIEACSDVRCGDKAGRDAYRDWTAGKSSLVVEHAEHVGGRLEAVQIRRPTVYSNHVLSACTSRYGGRL
jgi:hypothetical protein